MSGVYALTPKRSKVPRKRLIVGISVSVAIGVAVALTVGLVLHFKLKDDGDTPAQVSSRGVLRVDCYPELRRDAGKMSTNSRACQERGCVWKKQDEPGAPWCYFPAGHGYHVISGPDLKDNVYRLELRRTPSPPLYNTTVYEEVGVEVDMQTDHRLRVKIFPTNVSRWEIPKIALDIERSRSATSTKTAQYDVTFSKNPFGVVVTRKSSGAVVFNSSQPGLVLSDQFLQLTTRLTNENVYGFGEHRHESFKHDMNWRLWSMFTRDSGPNSDWNLYGQHPVYMNVEDDKKANMVLLKNSNAIEVLLQPHPDPAITYRTIGGVLDFYIFLGDSPADVVKHYLKAIGLPVFPPYWSLGYHLCRWGYANISDMQMVINRTMEAKIPYDGQWADVDTFHKSYVFTYDTKKWANFPALVSQLRKDNMHFVTIVDPGIGSNQTVIDEIHQDFPDYDMIASGEEAGIFIKTSENTTLIGEVWPGVTAYPDFTNEKSQQWWTRWIKYYREDIGVDVHALWIDMNEPSNFIKGSTTGCNQNHLNYPPYVPHLDGVEEKGELFVKTLCMDARQDWGLHYDVHSLYAHSMAMRTHATLSEIFPGKRPWTMTRASFVGTGHYATKWQGDNQARWDNMHFSIISLMEFGLFGFPMNGADICGFWLEPSYEMCVRWHQLGAFYPFARDHNGKGDDPVVFQHQDPVSFGSKFVDLVKPVLETRYKFLPYLYTQLYRAHDEGELVFKPLLFEFPADSKTLSIDRQFMLGPAFLLSPVLEPNVTSVEAYFPAGRWFDYVTGEEIKSKGESRTLATPLEKYNLHIRGGFVVPWQVPDVTTEASRRNDLGLLVALDEGQLAQGQLYWDDGVSDINKESPNYNLIKFEMKKPGQLDITPDVQSVTDVSGTLAFTSLEIYGLEQAPVKVWVNDSLQVNVTVTFNDKVARLTLMDGLPMTSPSVIRWDV